MWVLDNKEGWVPKIWYFQTVGFDKTLRSPLNCKEIKPVSPKGNQPWIFTGRSDAEAEAPVLWPPDAKSWLTGKDPMLRKIEGKRRREWPRMKWLDNNTDSKDMNVSKLWETVEVRGAYYVLQSIDSQSQTWVSDWRTTIILMTLWKKKSWAMMMRSLLCPQTQVTVIRLQKELENPDFLKNYLYFHKRHNLKNCVYLKACSFQK